MRKVVAIRLLLVSLLYHDPTWVSASDYYQFTVIEHTGHDGITKLGDRPSINKIAEVAFVATVNNEEGIYVGDVTSAPRHVSSARSESNFFYDRQVQINNNSVVIARDRVVGVPQLNFVRLWDATGDDTLLGRGSSSAGSGYENILVYDGGSLNNVGGYVFVVQPNDVGNNTKFVTHMGFSPLFPGLLIARPMMSDSHNGEFVARFGNTRSDPIILSSADFSFSETIASTGKGFSQIGRSPGISDDGQIVVFCADLSVAGASALTSAQPSTFVPLTPGPGIFASVGVSSYAGGRVIQRIAGLSNNGYFDPGETGDDNDNSQVDSGETDVGVYSSFDTDSRVAVNSTQVAQRAVTVAFTAMSGANSGLYSTRLNFFGKGTSVFAASDPASFTVARPTLVAAVGEKIQGLPGTIASISINDPLNDRGRGDVAFHVTMSAGIEAVIRAAPYHLVFLDFDPVRNFKLEPATARLFAGLKVDAHWAGTLATTIAVLTGSTRPDLSSDPGGMQDRIVEAVQSKFDDVDPLTAGNQKVLVTIAGRQSDIPPQNAPFTRVFIGDGPRRRGSPRPGGIVYGLSPIDVFNQSTDDTSPALRGSLIQKTPLIFADEILRGESDLFTDGSGTSIGVGFTGVNQITRDEVVAAMANVVAHEVGHSMGLWHLNLSSISGMIMSQIPASDTYDQPLTFANAPMPLAHGLAGTENSARRLAFAAGTELGSPIIPDPPNAEVVAHTRIQRANFLVSATITHPLQVVRAALGIIPFGVEHFAPQFIDLGSGDLSTISRREISVRSGDKIFFVASSTGTGIDIFSATPGIGSQVESIALTNVLVVLSEPAIRGDLFDLGSAKAVAADLFQMTPSGPVRIGAVGSPDAPPTLSIRLSERQVRLSWSAAVQGYSLQITESLSSGTWSTPGFPVVVLGDVNTITIPSVDGTAFYRLYKP